MQTSRRAVIDIGTNSIKILVADVCGNVVSPVYEQTRQTRLGRQLYETGRLHPESIDASIKVVGDFTDKAHACGAGAPRILATSAVRDAGNRDELLNGLTRRTNVIVEILSGEMEAEWAYNGVTTDPRFANVPVLVVDVGGGSSEFTLGIGKEIFLTRSFQLGTVRQLETLNPPEPPTPDSLAMARASLEAFVAGTIRPELEGPLGKLPATQLVATGGTMSIISRMQLGIDEFVRDLIEGTVIQDHELTSMTERLWSVPLEERKKIPGLPANRADVMLMGAAIFEAILKHLHFTEVRPSTRGLRFAALIR